MADFPLHVAIVRAPDSGGSVPRKGQRINGTGTTEATHTTALKEGQQASLFVGDKAVRAAFRSASGLADGVVTTASIPLGPYARFDWDVSSTDTFVYLEAYDGSSAYEGVVYQSSST